MIPAAFGLQDVLVPQNRDAHETGRHLVQGDVCARERHRWLGIGLSGNSSSSAIHPARTGTPVPSEAMVRPASTLQDVPVSLDLSPEDFAGVPERLDFTLPGSDESRHNPRENEASSASLEGRSYRTRPERHKPPTQPGARREDSKSP